jgi:hypothetical protein
MTADLSLVEELGRHSTPTVLNGLKRIGVHPSEFETMSRSAVSCMTPSLGPRVGFAATRRVWTSRRGPSGRARELSPAAIDESVLGLTGPRLIVAENVGEWEGPVCIWGEIVANHSVAMGCVGGITNGPVRDIDEMEEAGFLVFAAGADVGGGFVEIVDYAEPVEIGGVVVHHGDLLHGDRHGVVKVPSDRLDQLDQLVEAIAAVDEHERDVVELCRSDRFSPDGFRSAMQQGGAR